MKKISALCLLVFLIGCNNENNKTGNTTTTTPAASSADINGEQLFKINCAQCHNPKQDFTGPALSGATSRWQDKNLLHDFVKNSQAVIAKDAYAKALFTKWNGTIMQPFPQLSAAEIDAILDYCNTATE